MKAPSMMEASAVKVPMAPVETTPVRSARVGRSGESKGQDPHERESDDLLHGSSFSTGCMHARSARSGDSSAGAPDWRLHSNARAGVVGSWLYSPLDPADLTQFGRCSAILATFFDRHGS